MKELAEEEKKEVIVLHDNFDRLRVLPVTAGVSVADCSSSSSSSSSDNDQNKVVTEDNGRRELPRKRWRGISCAPPPPQKGKTKKKRYVQAVGDARLACW